VHHVRSAGTVREEGSVYRHSQQLPLSLQLAATVLTCGVGGRRAHPPPTRASSSQAPPARRQRAFLSITAPPLRPADTRAPGKGMTRRGRRLTTQARSTARRRSWRCRWAPFALCLQAAPSAHQSGHARAHPDAICAAPRSPPPLLSCEPEGRTTIVACFLACTRTSTRRTEGHELAVNSGKSCCHSPVICIDRKVERCSCSNVGA
jgi:hypothetical protein